MLVVFATVPEKVNAVNLLLSNGGAHLAHIACIAGTRTPYMHTYYLLRVTSVPHNKEYENYDVITKKRNNFD